MMYKAGNYTQPHSALCFLSLLFPHALELFHPSPAPLIQILKTQEITAWKIRWLTNQ